MNAQEILQHAKSDLTREERTALALDLELAEPGLGGQLYRDVEALQRRISKNSRLWQIARFNIRRAHL